MPDGTPITDGAQLAAGTEIKFLIYINNKGGAISDISIQDILDPAFTFVDDSLQFDNSQPACASNTCSAAEELAIFTAVSGTTTIVNGPTGTDVSYNTGTRTVHVGDQNESGNSQVDVAANSVYAILFSVTLN